VRVGYGADDSLPGEADAGGELRFVGSLVSKSRPSAPCTTSCSANSVSNSCKNFALVMFFPIQVQFQVLNARHELS
jgi:hypothetical protein